MSALLQDLRLAARTLSRAPGFAAAAVLSLAIGIGANTALFSVVDALLLRPLPYADADRLVILWNRSPGLGIEEDWFSTAQYFDVRNNHGGFEDVAIAVGANANLSGDGDPERVGVIRLSSNLLTMLGARPAHGRLFDARDDVPGGAPVGVLHHGTFRRLFGADPSVVGRTIRLDGQPIEIVGVLEDGFALPQEVLPTLGVVDDGEILLPLPLAPSAAGVRTGEDYNIAGKLRPGVTVAGAQAEMDALTARLRQDHPDVYPPNGGLTFSVVPLLEQVVGDVRRPLLVLVGAVACILLIACANVASLQLARAVARRREVAVRAALGASHGRVVRLILTESLLLAGTGAALGVALAWAAVRGIHLLQPPSVPRLADIGVNTDVLLVTGGIAVFAALLFGAVPASGVLRLDVQRQLRAGDRGAAGTGSVWARGQSLRRALVAGELALAVVLLIGAGLLVRSFAHLQQVPTGFRTDGVLTFELAMAGSRYPDANAVRQAWQDIWDGIDALPGVESVGGVTTLPLTERFAWGPMTAEGVPLPAGQTFVNADMRTSGGRYFEAMDIELVEGRLFTDADRADVDRVVVIDEAMAREFWPDASPLGRRVRYGDVNSTSRWETVVGVVRQVKHYGPDADARMALYRPLTQSAARTLFVTVRTAAAPAAILPLVRDVVRGVDPDLPMTSIATMRERLDRSMARREFAMLLLASFAMVAVVLATIGVYGVMAYMVAQGRRELGIRIALGATGAAIVRLVLRHGLTVTAAGLAAGLAIAALVTRLMANLLFGVEPTDALTFGGTAAALAVAAIAAALVPAWRASRVDPTIALRAE